ncbi:MFS transporter [Rahnella inusitata]|uniref:MFS transporter n=1 Tax=Rahnella inusitata TaxID=58169 RepID=A0ABX9P1H5_9GAMM|nr:MFS transporter [Rahnella inusitata]RJT12979.1 MFS transporter [Rahnella inusitata]
MNYRTRVAVVYLLGFFVDLINMFIANVAYPGIARHFQAPVSALAWVSTGYILGLTLVIPLSRWLTARFGARRIFIVSVVIFMLASLGAGTAGSLMSLIVWRIVQGLGGGLLIPVGQTLTYSLFRSHERARLSAMIMLVGLLAPALSPAFGGMIVDSFSWRWVFVASLPLAMLTWILALFWLRDEEVKEPAGRFELSGFLLAGAALALVLPGLTLLGETGDVATGVVLLLCGLILMTIFVRKSLQQSRPLLELTLIKDPLLRTAMLIYQCIPGIFTGISLIAMLYLQQELHFSAAQAGGLMVPWSLASFVAISVTCKMFNRAGPRALFIPGCLIQGMGIGFLAALSVTQQPWLAVTAFSLMGFGSSLCSSTAQSCAFLQVRQNALADASALWNINRQLSFCLGVTVVSVMLNVLQVYIPQHAYRLSFIIAAASVLLPVMLCLKLPGREIVQAFNLKEKR